MYLSRLSRYVGVANLSARRLYGFELLEEPQIFAIHFHEPFRVLQLLLPNLSYAL